MIKQQINILWVILPRRKMKTNLNTHDIYALVTELQYLIGAQVVNVYDITTQMICIKVRCKSGESQETEEIEHTEDVVEDVANSAQPEQKKHFLKYLIIESSTKFYVLDDFSAVNIIPSSFSMKLRKHLRGKRIVKFEQLNLDRVIGIQFGSNEIERNFFAYHLICEFYASGNIILTDHEYKIMTLIHPYVYKDEESKERLARVGVGNIYPINFATQNVSLEFDYVKDLIFTEMKKIDKKVKIKQFIMKLPLIMYSPNVVEHSYLKAGITSNTKIDEFSENIFTDTVILQLIVAIKELFTLKEFKGYYYDDTFLPYKYAQYNDTSKAQNNLVEFSTFSECVSQHFLKFDKFETKEKKAEVIKEQKVSKQDKALINIQNQITLFEKKTEENYRLIEMAESDIVVLQEFLDCVKNYVTFTNPNIELLEYIPHQSVIKFFFNKIMYIWDTNLSAYANLNNSFKENKQIKQKIVKAENALIAAEKSTKKEVKNTTENDQTSVKIKGKLKSMWFEEFNWFVTSDGLMFVSGKTADQNEQIVKKYLNDGDLYVHSEIFGSGSGVIKNNGKVVIERDCPKSIEESGNFLICHTKAWKTGIPDRAYYVYPDQVSKKPETGEYLSKGAFIVRGTKNFISVQKMELGLGVLFKSLNSEELMFSASDDIEFAMPIVATYNSLSNCKFKVKITPGSQKIKKIFPEVLGSFYKKSNIYEKAGIKLIQNDDWQKVLVTGVKFHL